MGFYIDQDDIEELQRRCTAILTLPDVSQILGHWMRGALAKESGLNSTTIRKILNGSAPNKAQRAALSWAETKYLLNLKINQ